MDRDDPAWAGQRDDNRLLLNAYDPPRPRPDRAVRLAMPIERPRRALPPPHQRSASRRGPGTRYFLEPSGLPAGGRIRIVDPNRNVLRHVSRRLMAFDVTAVEADVLKPLPVAGPYASAALHLVLHCLPGPLERKALAVANVAAVLLRSILNRAFQQVELDVVGSIALFAATGPRR